MAAHQLCVLLLQLIVPLLGGLRSFCIAERDDSVFVCHILSIYTRDSVDCMSYCLLQ